MSRLYSLFLISPKGKEEIVLNEPDPLRIHRIVTGRSFSKRSSKFGCSFEITKDRKNISFGNFERICLDLWFERKENE